MASPPPSCLAGPSDEKNQLPSPATQGLDPDAADGPRAEDQPHGLAGGKKKRSDRGDGREMADAQQALPLFAALKECEEHLGGRVRSQGGGFRDLPGRIPRRFRPYRGGLNRPLFPARRNEIEGSRLPREGFDYRRDVPGPPRGGRGGGAPPARPPPPRVKKATGPSAQIEPSRKVPPERGEHQPVMNCAVPKRPGRLPAGQRDGFDPLAGRQDPEGLHGP